MWAWPPSVPNPIQSHAQMTAYFHLACEQHKSHISPDMHFVSSCSHDLRVPLFVRYSGATPVRSAMDRHAGILGHRDHHAPATWDPSLHRLHHSAPYLLGGLGAHSLPAWSLQRELSALGVPGKLPHPMSHDCVWRYSLRLDVSQITLDSAALLQLLFH